MSEQHEVTTFWRCAILDDESNERCQPEKSIAQVQRHKGFLQRFASVMALFTMLAIAGVAYGTLLQENFPYNGSELVFTVVAVLGLASLICLAAFAGLLVGYPKKLKGLLDASQLVKRRQDSHLGKPDVTTLPGSYRGSDDHESFQGAAEVSGYHGSLDSPSWLSNRLCG